MGQNIFARTPLNEGKISVGLPVLILEFWCRHLKTKNSGGFSSRRISTLLLDNGTLNSFLNTCKSTVPVPVAEKE